MAKRGEGETLVRTVLALVDCRGNAPMCVSLPSQTLALNHGKANPSVTQGEAGEARVRALSAQCGNNGLIQQGAHATFYFLWRCARQNKAQGEAGETRVRALVECSWEGRTQLSSTPAKRETSPLARDGTCVKAYQGEAGEARVRALITSNLKGYN
jgi:hypothetical protein